MATKAQIAKMVQLRGLGYSLEEIAVEIGLSKSAVAYQLQKLKEASQKSKADEVFNAAILGGLVGAASGLAIAALIDIINKILFYTFKFYTIENSRRCCFVFYPI